MSLLADQVLKLEMTRSDGAVIELRRSGYLPDVFVCPEGRIFRLQEVPLNNHGSGKCMKYESSTFMAHHVVADALLPGWDTEHHFLEHIDGDRNNNHPSNLRPSKDPRRGRPRTSKLLDTFRALEILLHVRDLKVTAEETGLSEEELLVAMLEYMPGILRRYKELGITGISAKSIDRIGMPLKLRRLVNDGTITVDVSDIPPEMILGNARGVE